MDYEKIVMGLIERGIEVKTVKCDSCGKSNYIFREECKYCGDSLHEEIAREKIDLETEFRKIAGNSAGYPGSPSPFPSGPSPFGDNW